MNSDVLAIVQHVTVASDEERITFPEVVRALEGAGVERYHADLVCSQKTYYMPDGSYAVVASRKPPLPAQTFSRQDVEGAVRAIQADRIRYLEFCERIAAAGCVGYMVTLVGARAVYYGRDGACQVEGFPGRK